MFWILTVCLFVLASLFVLVPLWLRRRNSTLVAEELRAGANIALFHERENDLENELATGQIDQQQFDRLLLELQQNLLADTAADDSGEDSSSSGKWRTARNSRHALAVPLILAVLMPFAAYLMYQHWGYFDEVEHTPLYERTMASAGDPQAAQELIVALGQVVQANEELPWAWYFLAENFANIGMFTEAQIAYQRAADLLPTGDEKALVLGRVALAMYVNAEFELNAQTRAVIDQARAINPNEASVLQLLAADAEQNQDWASAIEYWRLLIQRNPNSAEAQELRQNIASAQQLLQQQNPELAAGPVIEVAVSLADNITVRDDQIVFIAARNAAQEGMPPLAAARLPVAELPTTVRLDNLSAVGPFNLSSAESVTISALLSQSGVATPAAGDYRVVSEPLVVNADDAQHVELTISERVQ